MLGKGGFLILDIILEPVLPLAAAFAVARQRYIQRAVIAGHALGVESVIDTVMPITFIHLRLKPGAEYAHAGDHDHNMMVYAFGGAMSVEGRTLEDGGLGLLSKGKELSLVAGEDGAECLLLGGPNLDEPIARYGPFVMNTREEIVQAIHDYNNGRLC